MAEGAPGHRPDPSSSSSSSSSTLADGQGWSPLALRNAHTQSLGRCSRSGTSGCHCLSPKATQRAAVSS
ncbi:hypothetical protein E2C01_015929 [Portunus trituberculatus]|uniref:Uncharacterized protein n=1 Tax=Portunus trituberculatus TaxID=210409 RepID=A0A5B7DMS6_PORTR|nr:hypothetical protein [Portunus trituberculatus]